MRVTVHDVTLCYSSNVAGKKVPMARFNASFMKSDGSAGLTIYGFRLTQQRDLLVPGRWLHRKFFPGIGLDAEWATLIKKTVEQNEEQIEELIGPAIPSPWEEEKRKRDEGKVSIELGQTEFEIDE